MPEPWIVAPCNENPITVLPPTDTVKPASAASPPPALYNCVPVISNWNPATGVNESNAISIALSPTVPKLSVVLPCSLGHSLILHAFDPSQHS